MGVFGHYLSDSDLRSIENYKYTPGACTALDNFLSRYLWEPSVSLFPQWLAPNVMTLLGFVASLAAFLVVIFCAPTLSESVPPWACITLSVCVFLYQTLDALDGKQARRTKSSSPLGTLFDHGCDIVTSTLLALASIGIMQGGVGVTSFLAFTFSCQTVQFLYLWWEYYFHVFLSNPGYGTGVSEAQCILMAIGIIAAVFGSEIFKIDVLQYFPTAAKSIVWRWGIAKISVCEAIMWPILVNNTASTLYFISKGLHNLKGFTTKCLGFFQFCAFFLFVGSDWLFYNNVIRHLGSHSVIGYFAMIFTYSTLCVRMLLASTSRRSYSMVQWPLLPFLVASGSAYVFSDKLSIAWLKCLASVLFVTQGVIFADLMVTAIQDLCSHLRIRCFSINKHHIS